MDQSLDAFFDLNERTVGHETDDLALDLLTDREALFDTIPRIGLHLLDAEGNAFLFLIDIENLNFHVLADLEHLAGMSQPGPRHVGDVQEAVDAVEIDEGT